MYGAYFLPPYFVYGPRYNGIRLPTARRGNIPKYYSFTILSKEFSRHSSLDSVYFPLKLASGSMQIPSKKISY